MSKVDKLFMNDEVDLEHLADDTINDVEQLEPGLKVIMDILRLSFQDLIARLRKEALVVPLVSSLVQRFLDDFIAMVEEEASRCEYADAVTLLKLPHVQGRLVEALGRFLRGVYDENPDVAVPDVKKDDED